MLITVTRNYHSPLSEFPINQAVYQERQKCSLWPLVSWTLWKQTLDPCLSKTTMKNDEQFDCNRHMRIYAIHMHAYIVIRNHTYILNMNSICAFVRVDTHYDRFLAGCHCQTDGRWMHWDHKVCTVKGWVLASILSLSWSGYETYSLLGRIETCEKFSKPLDRPLFCSGARGDMWRPCWVLKQLQDAASMVGSRSSCIQSLPVSRGYGLVHRPQR